MSRSVLETAHSLLKRRKFSSAITLLESRYELYENDFDYYLTLGTACLYVGDAGNAAGYYGRARELKLTDTNLLLGQAAIFLRRGDTDRAVQYYLDVLNNEPANETALAAMEFIRRDGDYSTICKWVDSGKIERFYPPLGVNPDTIRNGVMIGLGVGLVISMCILFWPKQVHPEIGPRADLTSLKLSSSEKRNAQESDLSGTNVQFLLDNDTINKSYADAMQYFQDHRDNAALVEINRLLNSNASFAIKQKSRTLMTYLEEPTFDTLLDNFTYSQVAQNPSLYLDCWVAWSGRISNAETLANGAWRCELLVGYENMKNVEGIVMLTFDPAPAPPIDGEKAVRILAKIGEDSGNIVLTGKSVYQPLKGKDLPAQ
jgi:tetratricopeptide (TPR) repeat protein